jgi:hypothetical protein
LESWLRLRKGFFTHGRLLQRQEFRSKFKPLKNRSICCAKLRRLQEPGAAVPTARKEQNANFPPFSATPRAPKMLNFAPKSRPEGLDEAPIFIRTPTTACVRLSDAGVPQRLREVQSETQKRCLSQRKERAAKKKASCGRLQAPSDGRGDRREAKSKP